MRISIRPSARAHLILDTEIRALVSFPALRLSLEARRPGAQPVLFIGPAVTGQPWIEVIADLADPLVVDVFHAMMLRRSLIESLGLDELIDPEYGPQRT
ncbi:hypothetical protein MSM1_15590 [Mycobacterium sp. SM1]|uniref:hypothetical protein n=1 Tax=Mycobacterium sp. SM1 TaxID=2816243 RepID=UPI001BD14EBF|nr:hypothetical protein [Mycobacterium sp. SM1]MBS4729704.1 hypothetical protein [Mycobacterium sp. SM1]